MKPTDLLTEIEQHADLDALRAFLLRQPDQGKLRQDLLHLLRAVVEYETVLEWSRAVRICESLAIVGWGFWERVDACSHFNGDCWDTWFVNHKGEHRFRFGRWRKRKAGWVLFNPEYHFSPDIPEIPSKDWRVSAGVDFPVVDLPSLPSQRNYQKQMPIVMGAIGGSDPVSNRIFELKRQLTDLLLENMRPTEYGDALEHFYLTLYGPGGGSHDSPGLRIGAYRAKERAFYCQLHFDATYGQLSLDRQKDFFCSAIERAVDSLEVKLAKRRLHYDFSAFRSDLQAAFSEWGRKCA